jgi:hypothetical protein
MNASFNRRSNDQPGPVKRRLPLFALVALLLSCIGLSVPFGLHAQGNDQKAPTEPADAAEIRQRIAGVEKRLAELPDRGAALYYLAVMKQNLGETREASRLLKECLALREGYDPSGSPVFAALVNGSKEFDELIASVHRDFPAEERARLAFVTEEKDLVPEGIAYDARRNVYYLSSLNRRKIVQIAANGAVSDFVPAGRDKLLPVLGIRLDPTDDTVWANSWAEDTGQSELLHFDASGKLLGRYAPKDTAKHGFNDLAVRKNGEVILTDSLSNQILRFEPATRTFAPLLVHRSLSEPNGIAPDDTDRQLFVADDFGVVRLDLVKGNSTDVNAGPRTTIAGADGLYWHNGSLIAIQNAIGSPRIAAFRLSKDGDRVIQTTILEYRTGFMVEPTTGAIHGNDFYFIVNSQGSNMNGDHVADEKKLERVRIGVLRLP